MSFGAEYLPKIKEQYDQSLNDLISYVKNEIDQLPPDPLLSKEIMLQREVDEIKKVYNPQQLISIIEEGFNLIQQLAPQTLTGEELDLFKRDVKTCKEKILKLDIKNLLEPPNEKQELLFQESFGVSEHLMYCFQKIGYQLYVDQQLNEANAVYQVLVFLNPFDLQYLISLGLVKDALEQKSEAIVIFLLAKTIDPTHPLPSILLSSLFFEIGEYDKAKEELHIAQEIISQYPEYEEFSPQIALLKSQFNMEYQR